MEDPSARLSEGSPEFGEEGWGLWGGGAGMRSECCEPEPSRLVRKLASRVGVGVV